MAGVVVLVINDCCPGRVIDDIPTILAVGDIRKLVTETIQCLGSCSKTQYQLDATQWTTIGSHLEQVGSGSIHAENWHVLGIRGGWGIGMIMRLHPWWVDSSPFIYSVGLLHFV